VLVFSLIAFGSYLFGQQQISFGSIQLLNPFYDEIKILPAWLFVVEYFILIFIISIFLIFTLIFYYHLEKNRKRKIQKKVTILFENKIVNYFFSMEEFTETQEIEELKALKRKLKTDHAKRLFLYSLRKVHSQTLGIVREKTTYLLKAVEYDSFIRAYLYSPKIRHKLFALKIISEFQLEGYEKYIIKLTKRNVNVLHSEALVTLVKLNANNNLLFLIENNIKLTLWDINVIIKALEQHKTHSMYYYYILIQSENPEVSALGIILARLHNRKDLKMDVREKIANSNALVNEEAFLAYVSFAELQEDFDFLIKDFELASPDAQIKIINAMNYCPDKIIAYKFLNWIVENKALIQKIAALQLLLNLDMDALSKFKQSENPLIRQSCLQVLDLNI